MESKLTEDIEQKLVITNNADGPPVFVNPPLIQDTTDQKKKRKKKKKNKKDKGGAGGEDGADEDGEDGGGEAAEGNGD